MDDLMRMFGGLRVRRNYNSSDSDSDGGYSRNYTYSNSYKTRNNQIDRKMFGFYKCEDCNRNWQSAHSWAGYGQKCKGCGKNTLPYKQDPLVRSEENKIDASKPHEKHLCAKCKKVGDCTQR